MADEQSSSIQGAYGQGGLGGLKDLGRDEEVEKLTGRLVSAWGRARASEEESALIRKQQDYANQLDSLSSKALEYTDQKQIREYEKSYNSIYDKQKDLYLKIEDVRKKRDKYQLSDGYNELAYTKDLDDLAGLIKKDPAVLGEALVGSVSSFAPELIGSSVVGAATGGAGVLGMLARAATMGFNSFRQNEIDSLKEQAQEAGYDIADPDVLNKIVLTGEFDNIKQKAVKGASGRAAFDALSAGVAGRLTGAAEKAGKPLAGPIFRELTEQAGLGAASEATGQLAESGDITNPAQVALEGGLELASAPIEMAPLTVEGQRLRGLKERANVLAENQKALQEQAAQERFGEEYAESALREAGPEAGAIRSQQEDLAAEEATNRAILERADELAGVVQESDRQAQRELDKAMIETGEMPAPVKSPRTRIPDKRFTLVGDAVSQPAIQEQVNLTQEQTQYPTQKIQEENTTIVDTVKKLGYNLERGLVDSKSKFRNLFPAIDMVDDAAQSQHDEALISKNQEMEQQAQALVQDSQALGSDVKSVMKIADEYAEVEHIPYLNKQHGEGAYNGITTKLARQRAAEIEQMPIFPLVQRVVNFVRETNKQSLDNFRAAGTIDQDLYDKLSRIYPKFTSFASVQDELSKLTRGAAGKFKNLKFFEGGEWQRASSLENALNAFKASAGNLKQSKTFNAIRSAINSDPIMGKYFEILDDGNIGQGAKDRPDVIYSKIDGNPSYIRIKDPDIAIELKNLDAEQVGGVMKLVGNITNFFKNNWVRRNPTSVLRQMTMDIQEALTNMQSTAIAGKQAEYMKNFGTAIATVYNSVFANEMPPIARKALVSIANKNGVDVNVPVTQEDVKLLERAKKAGIRTGGGYFGADVNKKFKNMIKKRQITSKNPIAKALFGFFDGVEALVDANDLATRLAAFKTAIENGSSDKQAADIAREITVNFSRKGKWSPTIEVLYPFFNSSVQGTRRALKGFLTDKNGKFSPRGLITAYIASTAAQYAIRQMNDALDEDWESNTDSRRNWVFVLGDGMYLQIPKPWGARPIIEIGRITSNALNGDNPADSQQDLMGIFGVIGESYNPMGTGDLLQTITPTILDPFVDLARNKDIFDRRITPEYLEGKRADQIPAHELYYQSLKDSWLGAKSIDMAKGFSDVGFAEVSPAHIDYISRFFGGGVLDFFQKGNKVVDGILSGNPVDVSDIPVASRFLRFRTPEQQAEAVERRASNPEIREIKEFENKKNLEQFYENKKATEMFMRFEQLPLGDQNKELRELAKTNRPMAERVAEKLQTKADAIGSSAKQRTISRMPVKWQMQWHMAQMSAMPTQGERESYFKELVNTGFIKPDRSVNSTFNQMRRGLNILKQKEIDTDKAFIDSLKLPSKPTARSVMNRQEKITVR